VVKALQRKMEQPSPLHWLQMPGMALSGHPLGARRRLPCSRKFKSASSMAVLRREVAWILGIRKVEARNKNERMKTKEVRIVRVLFVGADNGVAVVAVAVAVSLLFVCSSFASLPLLEQPSQLRRSCNKLCLCGPFLAWTVSDWLGRWLTGARRIRSDYNSVFTGHRLLL
jgi:hypothetical protein